MDILSAKSNFTGTAVILEFMDFNECETTFKSAKFHSTVRIQKVCRGVYRVTDSETFPVQISKDEAPTPLPVAGPLFISPCYFTFLEHVES